MSGSEGKLPAALAGSALPQVVFEHAEFLVVNKPPNLLAHPTRPDGAATLLGWVQQQFPGEPVSLINRLDRESSGAVLVARTSEAASRLGKMTMERSIHKEYLSLVWGSPEPDHGKIEGALGRLGISESNPIWLKQGIIPQPDLLARKSFPALSEYRVTKTFNGSAGTVSQVCLVAHTGRMHQLRVHMAHVGCPIIGDKIYGPDPMLYLKFIEHGWTAEHQEKLLHPRHALHAHSLSFEWRGTQIHVEIPWPEDLAGLMERLARC